MTKTVFAAFLAGLVCLFPIAAHASGHTIERLPAALVYFGATGFVLLGLGLSSLVNQLTTDLPKPIRFGFAVVSLVVLTIGVAMIISSQSTSTWGYYSYALSYENIDYSAYLISGTVGGVVVGSLAALKLSAANLMIRFRHFAIAAGFIVFGAYLASPSPPEFDTEKLAAEVSF